MNKPKFNEVQLFTPTEILELYPVLKNYHWTPKFIGELLSKNLLVGKITTGGRCNLVEIKSFIELIHFQNKIILTKKIDLNV